jgi:hypothetical protein
MDADLLAASQNFLISWRNYLSLLLNVPRVIDVRQAEMYTAEI